MQTAGDWLQIMLRGSRGGLLCSAGGGAQGCHRRRCLHHRSARKTAGDCLHGGLKGLADPCLLQCTESVAGITVCLYMGERRSVTCWNSAGGVMHRVCYRSFSCAHRSAGWASWSATVPRHCIGAGGATRASPVPPGRSPGAQTCRRLPLLPACQPAHAIHTQVLKSKKETSRTSSINSAAAT